MDKKTIKGAIQSLLFVSGEAISFVELQRLFDISEGELREATDELCNELEAGESGILVFATEDTLQLVTNPMYEKWLIKLLAPPLEKKLSDSIMETLSVIAYKQPVTRADIESIRGVRCEYAVSQLLKQGFICELGRKDCVGRPVLLGTTDAFLRKFGLHSLEELPVLPEPCGGQDEESIDIPG